MDLIVVTGPLGGGKSSVLHRLHSEYPDYFSFCTSHTTRAPRAGEVNGRDYHFVSLREFEAMVKRGEFIEYSRMRVSPASGADGNSSSSRSRSGEEQGKSEPLSDTLLDECKFEISTLFKALELLRMERGTPEREAKKRLFYHEKIHERELRPPEVSSNDSACDAKHFNYYGTSVKALAEAMGGKASSCGSKRRCVLADTDLRGAYNILRFAKNHNKGVGKGAAALGGEPLRVALLVVVPPSLEALRERLEKRKSETPASLESRMTRNRAWRECLDDISAQWHREHPAASASASSSPNEPFAGYFDGFFVNDSFERCYQQMRATVGKWIPPVENDRRTDTTRSLTASKL